MASLAILILFVSVTEPDHVRAQPRRIAITMDDAPLNAMDDRSQSDRIALNKLLLRHIDESDAPVAAFFNGKGLFVNDTLGSARLEVLRGWLDDPLITLGNHTFSHLNHAEQSRDVFIEDVSSMGSVLRELAPDKPLRYFRFPYNALGKDSLAQAERAQYLASRGYTPTPFTIESVDYMYNALYERALAKRDPAAALAVLKGYLDYTMRIVAVSEDHVRAIVGRPIDHIFLCHANALHAACYPQLIARFRDAGYTLISLEEALRDAAYQRINHYHGKHGISWIYRWIADKETRLQYLRTVPDPPEALLTDYKALKAPPSTNK